MSDLLERLREATAPLHGELEHHALMQRILGGRVTIPQYCLYLRNLHPIYAALERALVARGDEPSLQAFSHPALFRSDAIVRDLRRLAGEAWAALHVLPSADAYADSLHRLSATQPALLGAHAYVRYLGDLSGGRMVRSRVASALSLDTEETEDGLAFYAFVTPPGALARQLRIDLQSLPLSPAVAGEFVAEAVAGFERHRTLFDELERSTPHSPPLN